LYGQFSQRHVFGWPGQGEQETLQRLTHLVQNEHDETAIWPVILQELVRGLQLSRCQIDLGHATSSQVVLRYTYCRDTQPQEPLIQQLDFPPQACLVGYPHTTQFCNYTPCQSLTGAAVPVILLQPIADASGLLGEIRLERPQPDCFQEWEVDFVAQVAALGALMLRRNRFAQIAQAQTIELKRLQQIQDTFLSKVSYELRVPLANIRMAIQMVTLALQKDGTLPTDDLPASSATQSKMLRYLEVLQRECDRETKLIQDLLDLQQLDTNTLSLVISAIDLEDWLPYIVRPFYKRCQDHQLHLEYSIAPNLPALMCDQISLSRIVSELLNNAYKFTPSGEYLQMRVEQIPGSDPQDRGRVQIRVHNTGVEIPPEEQERVFEKFYRLPKLDCRKLGGTGLGLALVQKLLTRLGGTIQLESARNQTCFIVELPFQPDRDR
jgi:signal transduction histidine kinase